MANLIDSPERQVMFDRVYNEVKDVGDTEVYATEYSKWEQEKKDNYIKYSNIEKAIRLVAPESDNIVKALEQAKLSDIPEELLPVYNEVKNELVTKLGREPTALELYSYASSKSYENNLMVGSEDESLWRRWLFPPDYRDQTLKKVTNERRAPYRTEADRTSNNIVRTSLDEIKNAIGDRAEGQKVIPARRHTFSKYDHDYARFNMAANENTTNQDLKRATEDVENAKFYIYCARKITGL